MKKSERIPLDSFFKSPYQVVDLKVQELKLWGLLGKKAAKGENGKDAPSLTEIISAVIPLIPSPLSGQDGKDGKDGSPDTPHEIVEKINKSRGEKIKSSRIEGLEDLNRSIESTDRSLQRFMSIGGARQTRVASNGTVIASGATTLNFLNATVQTPQGNDGSTVDVSFSGGSGTGFQIPTGTVNGVNTVFTFVVPPNVISIDQGRIMQQISSDGTTNWTGSTTITLTIAPNNDIFGIA